MIARLRLLPLGEIIRYGLSGGVVWTLDFLTYVAVLQVASGEYIVANQLAKLAGAVSGFFLHRHFTFAGNQHHRGGVQFAMYVGVFVLNLASSSVLLWLLVGRLGADRYLAKIFVDAVVIATSFLAGKFVVYRKRA